MNCPVDTVTVEEAPKILNQGGLMLAGAYYDPFLLGYFLAEKHCVDCTLSGTNVRPPFWD